MPPAPAKAQSRLTGPQKTAVLLLALGDAFTAEVFKKLDRREITAVSKGQA